MTSKLKSKSRKVANWQQRSGNINVTLGIIWPKGRFLPFLDCFPNGIVRSNLKLDEHTQKKHHAQHPLQADQIRLRNLHFRPGYAQFLHSRPGYAVQQASLFVLE